jgi:ABC-type protease/lipase transport system fused ATPase/permease subunit
VRPRAAGHPAVDERCICAARVEPVGNLVELSVLIIGLVVVWGMFVRARRQLVVTLRDRADRAERAEIAAELFMSVATVKAHVSRLLQKLDLDNRIQIALLAHDAGVA